MEGTSPPGIFVGRFGYPKVNVGPLVPPFHGDTTLWDLPEAWLDFSIHDIIAFRTQLIRGLRPVRVDAVRDGGRLLETIQEIALAARPTELEVDFSAAPTGHLDLDRHVQPFGPSAPLLEVETASVKADGRLERAASDGDLKAHDAVLRLYRDGVEVSRITRALSAGLLGTEKRRKLVPTRWGITAVDDTVGTQLLDRVRELPVLDTFRVYESWKLDNRFIVLLMPHAWSYELIEAWYPGSSWNIHGREIAVWGDSEGFRGRTTYASIGGCYYAARLAVGESLLRLKRQASVLILREAHPGYIVPVGVWNVRENVRRALRGGHRSFDDLDQALRYVSGRLAIPIKTWIRSSHLLHSLLYQRRLEDFPGPLT